MGSGPSARCCAAAAGPATRSGAGCAVGWAAVFRDRGRRESLAVPWREILWAFRRMEARGTIRGGRFVTGFSGEQFAHPEAVDLLRAVRKQPHTGQPVRISAADPLN